MSNDSPDHPLADPAFAVVTEVPPPLTPEEIERISKDILGTASPDPKAVKRAAARKRVLDLANLAKQAAYFGGGVNVSLVPDHVFIRAAMHVDMQEVLRKHRQLPETETVMLALTMTAALDSDDPDRAEVLATPLCDPSGFLRDAVAGNRRALGLPPQEDDDPTGPACLQGPDEALASGIPDREPSLHERWVEHGAHPDAVPHQWSVVLGGASHLISGGWTKSSDAIDAAWAHQRLSGKAHPPVLAPLKRLMPPIGYAVVREHDGERIEGLTAEQCGQAVGEGSEP